MRTRWWLLLMIVLASACRSVPAHAQAAAPFPGAVNIDGGWVPCSHPLAVAAGRGCPGSTPAPSPPEARPSCDPRPDPYSEPERTAACAAWARTHPDQAPRPAVPMFTAGGTIRDAYGTRALVLALVRSFENGPVVVAQFVTPKPGAVFAFRADALDAARWEVVP